MSLTVRIIPCLDVRGGRVVKGINFKNIVDAGSPSEVAKRYDLEAVSYTHLTLPTTPYV